MNNTKILFISLFTLLLLFSIVNAQEPSIKKTIPKVNQLSVSDNQCCGQYNKGLTGNVDCSEDGIINLSDITKLIDHLFISNFPLCCEANGNLNGDAKGKVNIADMWLLIRHVYPKSKQQRIRLTARCR